MAEPLTPNVIPDPTNANTGIDSKGRLVAAVFCAPIGTPLDSDEWTRIGWATNPLRSEPDE